MHAFELLYHKYYISLSACRLEANEQDRILFIGSTSRPFADGVDVAGLKDSFDEKAMHV